MRVAEHVPAAAGDHRDARSGPVEQVTRRGRAASMVGNFHDVGALEIESGLGIALDVAREQY
jgi:hypothetical protein